MTLSTSWEKGSQAFSTFHSKLRLQWVGDFYSGKIFADFFFMKANFLQNFYYYPLLEKFGLCDTKTYWKL